MQHRIVMSLEIGRPLTRAEVVHHRNGDTLDNRLENLELMASRGRHLTEKHSAEGVRARMAGYPSCEVCGNRTAYGSTVCWPCWSRSQTCPVCGRPDRKMARRDICHGCYKRLRRHRKAKSAEGTSTPVDGSS